MFVCSCTNCGGAAVLLLNYLGGGRGVVEGGGGGGGWKSWGQGSNYFDPYSIVLCFCA